MTLDIKRVYDIEVEDVDTGDYPDFSDAFISYATYKEDNGTYRELTDEELEYLNEEHTDVVYDAVIDYLY